MKKTSDLLKGILLGSLISSLIFAGLQPRHVRAQNSYAFNDVAVNGTMSGSGVPQAGTIRIITTGTCGSGWTEASAMNGRVILGTLAANGDVGATGGSDSITPTVATLTAAAQTFTGNAGMVPAETFTGSSATTSSVSGGTPAGTNGTVTGPAQVISWPVGVPTNATAAFTPAGTVAAPTFTGNSVTSSAVSGGTPAGTISALTTGADSSTTGGVAKAIAQTPTFTGSALGTHTHTTTATGTNSAPTFTGTPGTVPAEVVSWPAGVPTNATSTIPAETFTGSALAGHTHTLTATGTNGTASFTPSGSNGTSSVTGTLSGFDNRSSFVKVIFCQKT